MSHGKSFWTRIIILPGFSCFTPIFYPESSRLDLINKLAKTPQREALLHEIFFLTNLPRKIGSKELSEPSFYIARGGDELDFGDPPLRILCSGRAADCSPALTR